MLYGLFRVYNFIVEKDMCIICVSESSKERAVARSKEAERRCRKGKKWKKMWEKGEEEGEKNKNKKIGEEEEGREEDRGKKHERE